MDWKAGLQFHLDYLDLFCFGEEYSDSSIVIHACQEAAKTVYDNCFHHQGIDEECVNPQLEKYMIQNNISGTYDTNYTKIKPGNSSAPSMKEFRADIINKLLGICMATGLDCSNVPLK